MGRSFRVGWSNTGQIAHAGKSMFKTQHESEGKFHGVVIENVYVKVHAKSMKENNRNVIGMICLEMIDFYYD